MRRPSLLTLGIDALAVHRLTRLATADVITRPLRVRAIKAAYKLRDDTLPLDEHEHEATWDTMPEADDDAPKLADFVKCRWCAGLWISGFVVVTRRYAPAVWEPLARVLAGSTVAALVAGLEAS